MRIQSFKKSKDVFVVSMTTNELLQQEPKSVAEEIVKTTKYIRGVVISYPANLSKITKAQLLRQKALAILRYASAYMEEYASDFTRYQDQLTHPDNTTHMYIGLLPK